MKVLALITACLALAAALVRAAWPAVEDLTAAPTVDPAALGRSTEKEGEKDYAGALKALEKMPPTYLVELRRGWLLYESGAYSSAVEHYRAAVGLAPASIEARLGCMLPLLAQQRYGETEALARQVLRIDSLNYLANLRLAYALRMEHHLKEAAEIDQRMLQYYPADTSFVSELNMAEDARG